MSPACAGNRARGETAYHSTLACPHARLGFPLEELAHVVVSGIEAHSPGSRTQYKNLRVRSSSRRYPSVDTYTKAFISVSTTILDMTGRGTVERIFTASEAEREMEAQTEVEAVAGSGLRGDRYFSDIESGTFVRWGPDEERPSGYDLTLIEREAITAIEREVGIELAPGGHRRNIETRDVALNHLVGQRFRVGDAICRGDRLCEPCDHLQRVTHDEILEALTHRGGLRADILEDGTIRPGDTIEPLE